MNRLLTATLLLSMTVTGCSTGGETQPPPRPKTTVGQPFEVLAGGGRDALAQRALDTDLTGMVDDLEVAPDGTAYLLVSADGKARIERIRPDGTHATIALQDAADTGRQLAVGPDGSVYVDLFRGDEKKDAIWRIRPDDSRQPVIGYNAGAALRGNRSIGVFGGLTVDPQGRLVFAVEVSTKGGAGVLIRRLEADGSVRTIAGRPTKFRDLDAARDATRAAIHPPASGKALDWGTTAAMHLRELGAQPDGTIVAATSDIASVGTTRTILTVTPTGSMREITGSALDGLAVAPAPFTPEGGVQQLGRLQAGVSAADGLLTVTTVTESGAPPSGGRYDWAGEHTEGQRAVLDAARGLAVRVIQPDGSVMTGAFGARSALHGGYLYVVVRDLTAGHMLLGRVKIPA
ncbi:NHL repeat-containing protein [Kribbella monticola]|uniref:hypothetical protein n=1 Tax=Kribbella monticola TaxID=2185285 RepID=UPI001300BE05|nr:hypothetical protein [Kribbella monticola]